MMSEERGTQDEGFLGRWSRLKTEAREAPTPAPAPAPATQDIEPAPELPRIETLSIDSDFRGFFHPKVEEDVRRAALRKLFSDPHFNVMDGLDVYIDDYSKSEPIPAAMLASLKQAQRILDWAKGKEDGEPSEEKPAAPAATETAPAAAPPAIEEAAADVVPLDTIHNTPGVRG
jgi:hypothetical protein